MFRERAAEIARAAVVVTGLFALLVAAAEIYRPGVVGAVLPLESLLGACALACAVSLIAEPPARERALILPIIAALALAAFAGYLAWLYFAPAPDLRPWMTAAAALLAGALVSSAWLARE